MANMTHPTKQMVRAYLERRSHESKPPPTPEEIRRQLGWALMLPVMKPVRSRS